MSERVELEYRRLLTEAMTRHGGFIFREYFEEGISSSKTFKEITEEMVKNMEEYLDEDSWPEAKKAAQNIHFKFQQGDLLGAWLEYFKWYPCHGEYAGLVVGILEREKKYKEALEILRLCKKLSGLDWDT
jgi:hypothetical protein